MTESTFDSARKVCRWAESEINDFEAVRQRFLREHPPHIVETRCASTGANVLYPADIEVPPEILDALERRAYRVVGDLRNALDQACHAASLAIGSTDEDKTNFPMATDEFDLDKRISNPKGSYRGIPVELHDKIKELRPFWRYRDGRKANAELRTIGQIANPNKHKVPLTIGFAAGGVGINTSLDVSMTINPTANRISKPDRPEVHWWIDGPNPRLQLNFETYIRIKNAGVFSKHDALPSFRRMHAVTTQAISALEEECVRILSER